MNCVKRIGAILVLITFFMFVAPLFLINVARAEAGMLIALILFFVIYPILSAVVGIIAGSEIKSLWFTPILTAVLFWLFSSITYKTAFPVFYSAIYFIISLTAMLIRFIVKKRKCKK